MLSPPGATGPTLRAVIRFPFRYQSPGPTPLVRLRTSLFKLRHVMQAPDPKMPLHRRYLTIVKRRIWGRERCPLAFVAVSVTV
jgi:hypothetical protein